MKRIIYALALAFVTILPFTSCTEEQVAPNTKVEGGGGCADNPIIKNA
jgi:hypothetical protein